MTVDRNQRYLVTARRDGLLLEEAEAEGEHLLPGVLWRLTETYPFAAISYRKIGHLHLVPAPQPEPRKPESIADLLARVLGSKL